MADLEEKPGLLSLPTMVRWFRPTLLANAAIRAAVSPVFGTFADARSVHANVDGFSEDQLAEVAQRYDLSEAGIADAVGAVWVDYMADTGDGFDSSYAMASLVAKDSLTVARRGAAEKFTLPAGKILILGGDQVYPFPSRQEYQERFVYPFKMAFSESAQERLTFVIPGNHDWYDGLNSFDYLFCQARYGRTDGSRLGSLKFSQHRSYFAIRLPYNWWIWGADIQFSDYLDAGQMRYFQSVAEMMRPRDGEPEHKVVLCIAAPGWQYEEREARAANSNTRLIAGIVEDAGAKVCAVLSGDAHHYCRYYSRRLGLNLVTAGGGGAFLHPTHQLHDDIEYRWQGDNHRFHLYCRPAVEGSRRTYEPAVFPSRLQSYWLTLGNVAFPVWNFTFATLLGTFYWLMTWMYSQTTINDRANCRIDGEVQKRPLVEDLLVYNSSDCALSGDTWMAKIPDLVTITLQAGIYQFLLGIYGLVMLIVLIMYADARSRWKRVVMGAAHWLVHIIAMVSLYILVNHYGYWEWLGNPTRAALEPIMGESVQMLRTVAYMVQMIVGGGFVAGIVWGLYLFFACAFFRRHWNDAFSSLRIPDYKNFLRLKIEPEKLTIFPIGLVRTPTRLEWRESGNRPGVLEPRIPLSPELIDGPVVIEPANVRHRPEQPGEVSPSGRRP